MLASSKSLTVALAVALSASPGVGADFLVLDVSPSDSTCAQENIEASVILQTDNCLKLPVESNLASSVKITSCTPGASDNIEVSVSVFNKDDCSSSFNFDPFVYTFDWPASCLNGTKLSCQTSDPYAVTENWPAFGLYVDDSTCTVPTLMAAFAPNCNTYSYENKSYSLDVTCSDDTGASLFVYGTEGTIPYEGNCSGTAAEEHYMVSNQCTKFETVEPTPIPVPAFDALMEGSLSELFSLLQLDASPDLYYYANCHGADNIPGSDTSANSDSNSDSESDIDAGMMALYLTMGGVGAALLVGGGFVFMRRKGKDESVDAGNGNTMNEDLLEKKK